VSQVLEWLDASPRFQRLPAGEAVQPEDLICFRLGGVPHHVELLVSANWFVHAMRYYGGIELIITPALPGSLPMGQLTESTPSGWTMSWTSLPSRTRKKIGC